MAQGYHAAAMDEIAERAGVSKPVLYQHFPSKRDLYLALLEQHTDELVEAARAALASTSDNKQRVAATMAAFFAFIDSESESFRLVFESDFTSDHEVRELLDRMQRGCAEAIAESTASATALGVSSPSSTTSRATSRMPILTSTPGASSQTLGRRAPRRVGKANPARSGGYA